MQNGVMLVLSISNTSVNVSSIGSLLSRLSKTSIDNELCRNEKDRRSYTMQLRPLMADNVKKQISNMSEMSYCNLKEEACCHFEKGRAGAKTFRTGGCNRSMTLNDDVISGKYGDSDGVCDICNYHHNVIVISLEGGDHIRTKPFSKNKATIMKAKPASPDFLGD
jgi:hypothetical protein